ncbi:hypothetical protein [Mycobacterium decipiens]|uniref:Uncharacterized protein n=1 Tax=Mycobacterium decipiens TaxID=1430326 RepID=A0A1X2LS22_9MYCO|nr:hypothetical protein [Mycobacterium decipiens]OSC39452.1 hypothetical protein B8W66_17070 [Mycobacterium decipiens]
MDFMIQWSCYLLAFVAGSAVAWVIVSLAIKRASEDEDAAQTPSAPEVAAQ